MAEMGSLMVGGSSVTSRVGTGTGGGEGGGATAPAAPDALPSPSPSPASPRVAAATAGTPHKALHMAGSLFLLFVVSLGVAIGISAIPATSASLYVWTVVLATALTATLFWTSILFARQPVKLVGYTIAFPVRIVCTTRTGTGIS